MYGKVVILIIPMKLPPKWLRLRAKNVVLSHNMKEVIIDLTEVFLEQECQNSIIPIKWQTLVSAQKPLSPFPSSTITFLKNSPK